MRFSFLNQFGEGYQSQAGPPQGPGDERLLVYQPAFDLKFRANASTHDVRFSFDAVTSASADSLEADAMTSASRHNEAGELVVTHRPEMGEYTQGELTYGVHLEEHWRTFIWGMGVSRRLHSDNITVSANVVGIFDTFDQVLPSGDNNTIDSKQATSINLGYSQIFTRTTLAALSYGFTYQSGVLETSWNSVVRAYPDTNLALAFRDNKAVWKTRVGEIFPDTRRRHALALRAAQHIPASRSSVHAYYRWYGDDYGLRAHTASCAWYQWLGRRVYVRADYRFHVQNAVDFWMKRFDGKRFDRRPRTADSDLAAFVAHEWGGKLVFYLVPPGSARAEPRHLSVGYSRYQRSNALHIDAFSIGYGHQF